MLNCDDFRDPSKYVHHVERTARAGRGGLVVSFVIGVRMSHHVYKVMTLLPLCLHTYDVLFMSTQL